MIAAKVGFDFNERFRAGLLGYWFMADEERTIDGRDTDTDLSTYGAYLGFAFTPSIELKGVYYMQDQGDTIATLMSSSAPGTAGYDDSANAWKAILDVKQDVLKFTSLWLEYGQIDNNFLMNAHATHTYSQPGDFFGDNPYAWGGAEMLANMPYNTNTSKVWLIRANQQWNDKWRTFLRYAQADFDTDAVDDATNWSVGVGYRFSPAIEFELMYDAIDYGDSWVSDGVRTPGFRHGDDNVIRFRTYVTF